MTQRGISVRCAIVYGGARFRAARIGEHLDNVQRVRVVVVVVHVPPGTQICGRVAQVAIKHITSLRQTGNVPILNL